MRPLVPFWGLVAFFIAGMAQGKADGSRKTPEKLLVSDTASFLGFLYWGFYNGRPPLGDSCLIRITSSS